MKTRHITIFERSLHSGISVPNVINYIPNLVNRLKECQNLTVDKMMEGQKIVRDSKIEE